MLKHVEILSVKEGKYNLNPFTELIKCGRVDSSGGIQISDWAGFQDHQVFQNRKIGYQTPMFVKIPYFLRPFLEGEGGPETPLDVPLVLTHIFIFTYHVTNSLMNCTCCILFIIFFSYEVKRTFGF